MHDHAMDAALAVQAAHRQGKAWAIHDKMFENNQALAREDLQKYAGEIGLDVAKFKADMDDPKTKEEVLADQKVGNSVGAGGTPTLFVNGRKIVGARPFEDFKAIIDAELKAVEALLAAGTPPSAVYEKRSKTP